MMFFHSSGLLQGIVKKTFATITVLFLVTGVFSQTLISGKVKDGKGHPIPGASVSVKNSFDGATSDSTGNYQFNSSDTGTHTLTVSSVGYKPMDISLKMAGKPIHMDIQLK